MQFADQQIMILGLDASAQALAAYLRQAQAQVCLAIANAAEFALLPSEQQADVQVLLQADGSPNFPADLHALVVCPAVAKLAETEQIIKAAQAQQVKVFSELDVYALALQALAQDLGYAPELIALAGSNGKSTVSSLLQQLCGRAGRRLQVLRNTALLESLLPIQAKAAEFGPLIVPEIVAEDLFTQAEPAPQIEEPPAPQQAELDGSEFAVESAQAEIEQAAIEQNVLESPADAPSVTDLPVNEPPLNEPLKPEPSVTEPPANQRPAKAKKLSSTFETASEVGEEEAAPPDPRQLYLQQLPDTILLVLEAEQLRHSSQLQADVACVLNLYPSEENPNLAADTARIFGPRTTRVLNRDDALVGKMLPSVVASLKDEPQIAPVISFACDAPQSADSIGVANERGMQWLSVAVEVDESAQENKPKRRKKGDPVIPAEISLKHLMPVDALKIRGQHNAANALAALTICRASGLAFAPILHALREFSGQAHCLGLVRQLDEIAWYDDSASKNLAASAYAIKTLASQDGEPRLLCLLQGQQASADALQAFARIAGHTVRSVRQIFIYGADAASLREQLAPVFQGTACSFAETASLQQAIADAASLARSGDSVLLSPASADLASSASAQIFTSALQELALARGQLE